MDDRRNPLPDLIPVRMLNEFTYCPRLCWIEWIEGEFLDSADTLEGNYHHRRVDRQSGSIPDADKSAQMAEDDDNPLEQARAVMLSAPQAGLIAKMDLIEAQAGLVVPVEVKRGAIPNIPSGAYEPEKVQLCAQAIILRENGYRCDYGELYYASSRRRVRIDFDEALVNRTFELADAMRAMALEGVKPPPLDNSPKCPRCSLVPFCLPDETLLLMAGEESAEEDRVRRLLPARDDAIPCIVQKQGAVIGKQGDCLTVKYKGELQQTARLMEISQLCVFGNVQITTQAQQQCLSKGVPIVYFSTGGWFYGYTSDLGHKNILLRQEQFRMADDPQFCLKIARGLVNAKILNCRTLLRRNHPETPTKSLQALKNFADQSEEAQSIESLLGIEGMAAKIFFSHFDALIKPTIKEQQSTEQKGLSFNFKNRNRRPPTDPINALLSYAYALFAKDWHVTLAAVGLDPFLGFYHQPRYGRPALALDMMEPFRPLIPDSVVLWAVNNRVIALDDFIQRPGTVALTEEGRKKFIRAYEKRMDDLVTHPVFNYRISYRRVLEVQARLLSRTLTGEIDSLPPFMTR
jgi:CRISPR-associated protein Cas1